LSSYVITKDADAGVVSLADGTTFHGDVIVAADGIRSAMRPFILGENGVPQTTGESAYRTLLRLEDLQAVDCGLLEDGVIGPTIHVVKGPRRKIVAYPCRGEKMLNIAAMIRTSTLVRPRRESLR
jgi:salicylate hydroxylase